MDRDEWYALLEDKFLTYQELRSVRTVENGEPMLPLVPGDPVGVFVLDERMKRYTGDQIFVRAGLIKRLRVAQDALRARDPSWSLDVVYGYRHMAIQQTIYDAVRKDLMEKKVYPDEAALQEAIHHFIAVPEVSGHPTGGAVDIRILDQSGVPCDMGTAIHAFVKDSYVFSPFIAKEAWHNRQILRGCMMKAGFAPYDGEWWHFSYGDREWAKFYGKAEAIYSQLSFSPAPVRKA